MWPVEVCWMMMKKMMIASILLAIEFTRIDHHNQDYSANFDLLLALNKHLPRLIVYKILELIGQQVLITMGRALFCT